MLRRNRQDPVPAPPRSAAARCDAGQLLDPGACPWHTAHVFCPDCEGWFGIPHEEHRPRGAGDISRSIDYFGYREPDPAGDQVDAVSPEAGPAAGPVQELAAAPLPEREPGPAAVGDPGPRLYHPYAVRTWLLWQLEQPGAEPLDPGTVHALVARLGIVDPPSDDDA